MELAELIKRSQGKRGHIYPDVFSDTCGLDILMLKEKLHAVKSWGYTKGNPKRRATLNISTFRGISIGAIHYYGTIVIQGVNMEYDGTPGHSRMILDRNIPLAHYTYEIELNRSLTKEEINEDPERWGDYYEEGDLTNCFEKISDLLILAKEIFEKRFIGDWAFTVDAPFDSCSGSFNDVYKRIIR